MLHPNRAMAAARDAPAQAVTSTASTKDKENSAKGPAGPTSMPLTHHVRDFCVAHKQMQEDGYDSITWIPYKVVERFMATANHSIQNHIAKTTVGDVS
jgi:hypothetical protein